jgi:hypothetical protein
MNAMKKNIAFCFYGQPRLLKSGYNVINQFIRDECSDYNVHVYVHTWWDKSLVGQYYSTSPWRHIPQEEKLITEDVIQTIINLYNPIQIEYEAPRDFKDEIEEIQELDIFKNSPEIIKNNIRNTLSNFYSKYKTSLLLKNSNIDYDCIISLRFDNLLPISLDLSNLISNKVYIANVGTGRVYLPDHFVIFTNNKLFVQYSSTFCNIKQINESSECKEVASKCCIEFKCNIEELLIINYGLYYSTDQIFSTIIQHNCLSSAYC